MSPDHLSRRKFLQASAATAAVASLGAAGRWRIAEAGAAGPIELRSASGASFFVGGPLPVPKLLRGKNRRGRAFYKLKAKKGKSRFMAGRGTRTLGYNGKLLGPTLLFEQGDEVEIRIKNKIGRPTTVHWHGMHVPGAMDGGPHQVIASGKSWTARYPVLNRASTYWYHPHPHVKDPRDPDGVSHQVYEGLAGFIIVQDEHILGLGLPMTYGVDDFPLVIQDRRFQSNNQLFHLEDEDGSERALRKGDTFLVNGAVAPVCEVPAQMVRLRILNGSNARLYRFGLSDNRNFYQIGSDGGLLEKPLRTRRVTLSPAERAEIVVDFSDDRGSSLELCAFNDEIPALYVPQDLEDEFDRAKIDLMTLEVGAPTQDAVTKLPKALAEIDRLKAGDADLQRTFILGPQTINGQRMDLARIDEEVKLGNTEIWKVTNATDQFHNFHPHGDSSQVLTRGGKKPGPEEMGWKDVVLLAPGETVELIKRFEDYADPDAPYMHHCHILEHEDHGMMGQFIVV